MTLEQFNELIKSSERNERNIKSMKESLKKLRTSEYDEIRVDVYASDYDDSDIGDHFDKDMIVTLFIDKIKKEIKTYKTNLALLGEAGLVIEPDKEVVGLEDEMLE